MKILPDFFKKVKARAKNDAGERIESLRFSVPALRVGVLEYGAGQLQTGNSELEGKAVKLYYPPEAVSDEKFLKSLETAPVVVGGHDSTTNEQNKKIDGWAHNVFFDKSLNAAMIAGVVKGAKEVAYIKGNLGASGFGASAFVDIYNLKVENGITPDGQEYNAIANDLRATHVALAPHVRDPENKIKVTNAVCVKNTGEMTETTAENIDYKRVITSEVERKLFEVVKAAKAEGNAARLVFDADVGRAIDRFESSLSLEDYKNYNSEKTEDEIERRFKEIATREGVRVANTVKNTEDEMEISDEHIKAIVKNIAAEMAEEMLASAKNGTEWVTKVSSVSFRDHNDTAQLIKQIKDSGDRRAMELWLESWEKNTEVRTEAQSAAGIREIKAKVDKMVNSQK